MTTLTGSNVSFRVSTKDPRVVGGQPLYRCATGLFTESWKAPQLTSAQKADVVRSLTKKERLRIRQVRSGPGRIQNWFPLMVLWVGQV